jgi:acyl-coenzyme A synthetase/AMP-(fatty) acid ligase
MPNDPRRPVVCWCVGRHGEVTDYSYRNLRDETGRFANLLR